MSDVFTDIKQQPLPEISTTVGGQQFFDNLFSLAIGSGGNAFKADKDGIWLGADKFANAPFKVNMQGLLTAAGAVLTGYASSTDVSTLMAQALLKDNTTQILGGVIKVGGNNYVIDGVNRRSTISDGANIRILMGYQLGGF